MYLDGFDTVNHELFIGKLHVHGLFGNFLEILFKLDKLLTRSSPYSSRTELLQGVLQNAFLFLFY